MGGGGAGVKAVRIKGHRGNPKESSLSPHNWKLGKLREEERNTEHETWRSCVIYAETVRARRASCVCVLQLLIRWGAAEQLGVEQRQFPIPKVWITLCSIHIPVRSCITWLGKAKRLFCECVEFCESQLSQTRTMDLLSRVVASGCLQKTV